MISIGPNEVTKPSDKSICRWYIWLPLLITETYLTFTVLLFAFGPWPWPVSNPVVLYFYLGAVQLSFAIGYLIGIHKYRPSYNGIIGYRRLLDISITANIVWLLPKFYLRTGMTGTDITRTALSVLAGVLDPGQAYLAKQEALASFDASPVLTFLSLFAWSICWFMLPLGVVLWHHMDRWRRYLLVTLIAADLAIWLTIGTTKGIADLAILLPWLLLIKMSTQPFQGKLMSSYRLLISIVVILVLGFSYFSWTQSSRRSGSPITKDFRLAIPLNRQGIMMRHLPSYLQDAVGSGSSYFTQGYYFLSMTLNEEFDPTWGVGNSFFLQGLAVKLGYPDNLVDLTYPAKLESQGIDRYERWHSAYPWWASDVTFPGTLLIMVLIGLILSRSWMDATVAKNPFGIALSALMAILVFYLPANNQMLAFSVTAMPFFSILPLWYFSHRRRYLWK